MMLDERTEIRAPPAEVIRFFEPMEDRYVESHPDHLDFAYTDVYSPPDVEGRTVRYEGPVRGLCRHFPRNFNSHGVVAMAGLGLDETRPRLIADPAADSADHVITASGEGFDTEITRESAIEGVTGDYTLVSIWGSMRRVLTTDGGLRFV